MKQQEHNGVTFLSGDNAVNPDKASLVLIHGSGQAATFWEKQIAGLQEVCNVIALDLPGHGRNSQAGMQAVSDYTSSVAAFLRDMQLPNPVLGGLSLGGAVTLDLLLTEASLVVAGIIFNSGARLRVMPQIFEMIQTDYPGYVAASPMVSVSPKTPREKVRHLFDEMLKVDPKIIFDDFKACDNFDVIDRLADITVPTLILTATDDKLTPEKFGVFMADKIPSASHVSISDAGHLSPVEKPEEVNQAIKDFLQARGF